MNTLQSKIAIVTGSTRGFGLAVAKAFQQEGASVVVSSRDPASVERTVKTLESQGEVVGLACDVSDLAQVQALADYAIASYGGFDVWVNNAGITPAYGPTIHLDPQAFIQTTLTYVLGTYHGSLVAMRHFLSRRSGKLINLLGFGHSKPAPMLSAYGSSKAWVARFTQSLAQEYKDSGVGVFALNPGMMDTEMVLNIQVIEGYEDRLNAMEQVLRILSQSPEVSAHKAVWLASAATDGKTGLVARETTRAKKLRNALREAFGELFHRPKRPVDLRITSVPSAFPVSEKPGQ
jgi:NAD(P)-dependent dehydrogenase (short-subunit alcohol dehydrogenase family)